MTSGSTWRIWRGISLLFGALIPVLLWSWMLTGGSKPLSDVDGRELLEVECVALEVGGLVFWLFKRHRTRAWELAFSGLFGFGALFAAYWCLLGAAGIAGLLEHPKLFEGFRWMFVLAALSPFPCVPVYAINAVIALVHALRLKSAPPLAARA